MDDVPSRPFVYTMPISLLAKLGLISKQRDSLIEKFLSMQKNIDTRIDFSMPVFPLVCTMSHSLLHLAYKDLIIMTYLNRVTKTIDKKNSTLQGSRTSAKKSGVDMAQTPSTAVFNNLSLAAQIPAHDIPAQILGLETSYCGHYQDGLTPEVVLDQQEKCGANEVNHTQRPPLFLAYLKAFGNPFILILLFLASVMVCTDIIFANPHEGRSYTGVTTILIMVMVSATLRCWQERRAENAADALKAMVQTSVAITRNINGIPVTEEMPLEEVVPGDIIQLAAGDMIPADIRLMRSNDLQLNQSTLTGEALPVEKFAEQNTEFDTPLNSANLAFMGTSVISGSGTGIVIHTGRNTYFGNMAGTITSERTETAFDKGIKSVTFMLIRFMCVMVPIVFVINGFTKGWTSAFLFGITTAVGMTPEMLPLIVTANLAKGARMMAKRRVIVKRLNAIQDLGAMDVLCTDKTGTLTEDRIILEQHFNVQGTINDEVLHIAAANAFFQTGLRNLLDQAIIDAAGTELINQITDSYTLVDEIPFDFVRRRLSVVIDDGLSHTIITKGAAEEMLASSSYEMVEGEAIALTPERLGELRRLVAHYNKQGMRVLGVAIRSCPRDNSYEYTRQDETQLTIIGFLAFLDPPKASAQEAINALRNHGTDIKVITGDNEDVAIAICRQVGIDTDHIVLGHEIEDLDIKDLAKLAQITTLFAKVSPSEKARIVEALRTSGKIVGYLGDGINDAAALSVADVGISVDSGTDIAKESADIILLEKDLNVLEQGVIEGRRTFINTMKYIKTTASSNFGTMFSILVASAFLPFLPMLPIVVLVQNLVYDLSMLTMPWDNVDREELIDPRRWEANSLRKFMLNIGPISSLFDIATFALMWFIFSTNTIDHASLFQSGWFIESIISQTLVVHMLRTRKVPFFQSRVSLPVFLATGSVCVFGLILPFSGWGHSLGLVALPHSYFPWLVLILGSYFVLSQLCKNNFIKRNSVWI